MVLEESYVFSQVWKLGEPQQSVCCVNALRDKIVLKKTIFILWMDEKYFLKKWTLSSFFQLLKTGEIEGSLCLIDDVQSKNTWDPSVIVTTCSGIFSTEVALRYRSKTELPFSLGRVIFFF